MTKGEINPEPVSAAVGVPKDPMIRSGCRWEGLQGETTSGTNIRKTGNHQHEVVRLNIGQIEKIPTNPVKFDELELRDLARSIQEMGDSTYIVRRAEDGFQLVAGKGASVPAVWRVGMSTAIIYDMEEEQAAAMSLVENLQRKDLNYFEEAEAYATLVVFGPTQEEVAQRVGKSQSAIANKLRLLNLPDEIG